MFWRAAFSEPARGSGSPCSSSRPRRAHIWAEKYDGSLDDIFDLQDRITEQVAGALQPSIRLAEVERARRKRPQDLGAYDYAMRAMRHVWRLEKDEATRGLALLDKALEIDPDYPLALALAAWCHAQRSVYNWVEDIPATQAAALRYAERAADLSADDPLILAVLGTVHTFVRNYGTARILLERALTLDPNSAWAHSRMGWLENYTDRPLDAREHFERAIRLSPLDPLNFNNHVGLGFSYAMTDEHEEAVAHYRRALQERPNALWILRDMIPALVGAGRMEEARVEFKRLMQAYPDLTAEKMRRAIVSSPEVFERKVERLKSLGLPD